MSWHTAKRLLQRKPYLLDPYRCRSANAAKRMLVAEGIPSAEKVLSGARIRAGKSASEWEAFTGMQSKIMESKCKQATPVRFGKLFMLSRRAVIAISILIVLTTFIACTPIGRAWAVAIYNEVAEVIGNILYVGSEKHSEVPNEVEEFSYSSDSVMDCDSLDIARAQMNQPLFYLADSTDDIIGIQLSQSSIYGSILETTYLLPNQVTVIITQSWGNKEADAVILDENKEYVRIELPNGIIVEGAFSEEDFIFTGTCVSDDVILNVYLSGATDVKMIISSLLTLSIK